MFSTKLDSRNIIEVIVILNKEIIKLIYILSDLAHSGEQIISYYKYLNIESIIWSLI
jgi:hypothetical protein